jgi:hypothetical protein
MITFQRRKSPKATLPILVKFDQNTDQELRDIADTEEAYLIDVIRTFTELGLAQYRKEQNRG